MKAGRWSDYEPSYCDDVIRIMSEGGSLLQVAKHLGCVRNTLYNWAKEYPEFAEALDAGREMEQAYWEEHYINPSLKGEITGNASVLNFQLKNKFRKDYQDGQNLVLSGGDDPIKVEDTHTIKFIMPNGLEAPESPSEED